MAAQYSQSPSARSFQTITIAMQRAIPTMIRPYMRNGWSRRKTTARINIRTGPTIQFWTSDRPRTFVSLNTVWSSSYRTFASGGYIMRISPMAIGIDVVPTERLVISAGTAGEKYPMAIPAAMARKIQSVRYRSRNESFFVTVISRSPHHFFIIPGSH